jgi:methionyl-tRNA synthetase
MHLRVGKIISVGNHPNADSLYLMKVDFGSLGVRQVVAGLKKYVPVDKLLNHKAVFCVNLKPAKLRGEMSEAMILAADDKEHVVPLYIHKSEVGEEAVFEGMNYETKEITFDDLKNFKMSVKAGNIVCEGKKLKTKVEEIKVVGVKEGGEVR